jgi:hypothetical protein
MSILDFKEIPRPSQNKSSIRNTSETALLKSDLDAFEKFSEEFFEKIMGYTIETRIARGGDLGADLIAIDGDKRVLVSCKHYAFSDGAVGLEERDVIDRLATHHCSRFIGFYSTGATTGLRNMLKGIATNPAYSAYEFDIMKSSDIESKLLDKDDAAGWVLTARYFPKSFANLFRRFVVPIEHYKESDVKQRSANTLVLEGPYGGTVTGNSTKKEFVDWANDNLTNAVHRCFFREAMKEAIDVFPSYFHLAAEANQDAVKLSEIRPAWTSDFSQRAISPGTDCNTAIIVCALWSFWDKDKATDVYIRTRTRELELKNCDLDKFKHYMFATHLSIGFVLKCCNSFYRDIFARLAAFCPTSISSGDWSEGRPLTDSNGQTTQWNFEPTEGYDFLIRTLRLED